MPYQPTGPLYEIDLSCGDTISSRVKPQIGARRNCIHCDAWRTVTGVRDPRLAGDTAALARLKRMLTGSADDAPVQGELFSYAHDAGLYRETLVSVRDTISGVLETMDVLAYVGVGNRLRQALASIDGTLAAAQTSGSGEIGEGISPNFDDDPR